MGLGLKARGSATVLFPLVLVASCTTTYYKAMSTFGKEKRDILRLAGEGL
jgi:hypothetical protein